MLRICVPSAAFGRDDDVEADLERLSGRDHAAAVRELRSGRPARSRHRCRCGSARRSRRRRTRPGRRRGRRSCHRCDAARARVDLERAGRVRRVRRDRVVDVRVVGRALARVGRADLVVQDVARVDVAAVDVGDRLLEHHLGRVDVGAEEDDARQVAVAGRLEQDVRVRRAVREPAGHRQDAGVEAELVDVVGRLGRDRCPEVGDARVEEVGREARAVAERRGADRHRVVPEREVALVGDEPDLGVDGALQRGLEAVDVQQHGVVVVDLREAVEDREVARGHATGPGRRPRATSRRGGRRRCRPARSRRCSRHRRRACTSEVTSAKAW